MLGGVAAGFGRYLDVDPVLVRLGFVVLAFANGLGVLLYVACLVLMPRDEPGADPWSPGVERALAGGREARLVLGYVLIALGVVFLLHNLDWIRWPSWARFEVLWPIILVAMGVGLLRRSVRKEPA
jgi:phage shock protein PspC (stress-responsive transcriptional regulator)